MSDVFTRKKRSAVMARIRGCGNRETELALTKLLRSHGVTGWRRNQPVFGKPDFIFPPWRVAVFVDGCFWHGCPKHSSPSVWLRKSSMNETVVSRVPMSKTTRTMRTGKSFWREKLAANLRRDRQVNRRLHRLGWKVVRIWEHELTKNPERCVEKIKRVLVVRRD